MVEGYGTPQAYIPVYLLLMGVAGGVALLLALIGAKSCAAAPIRAVIAGAMAAGVLTVPFAVLALYVISHWSNGDWRPPDLRRTVQIMRQNAPRLDSTGLGVDPINVYKILVVGRRVA